MNRLQQLEQLRARIDVEIEREKIAAARQAELLKQTSTALTRGSWSQRCFTATCLYFAVDPDDVLDGGRARAVVDARHVAMWLMRDGRRSYPEVAAEFGCDHTTVMNAVRRVNDTPALKAAAHTVFVTLTGEEPAA